MHLRRAAVLCTLAALCGASAATAQDGCLYGKQGAVKEEGCADDPLALAAMPEVQAAIRTLGLSGVRIGFRGCRQAAYAARQRSNGYLVVYEIPADGEREAMFAPIFHELGHIYQYRLHGSYARMTDAMPLTKIELGADFIAGLVHRGQPGRFEMQHFQQNLMLVGRYDPSAHNTHGTPEQRTMAFRFGVFRKADGARPAVADALADFEHNLYGWVMAQR